MSNPITKTKIAVNARTISLFFLCFYSINSSNLFAQDPAAELTKALEEFNERFEGEDDGTSSIGRSGRSGRSGTVSAGAADGYKSFVQNELQNIFYKAGEINEQQMEDITFAGLNDERIKLAITLCETDQRACFLIDEYKSYKSKADMPKVYEDLQLFGLDIFFGFSNEFNFYDSLPLDDNYIIKIGDVIKISLFGIGTSNSLFWKKR